MRVYRLAVLLASVGCSVPAVADCLPRKVAPAAFLNTPAKWHTDSGPILDGFVDLRRGDGTHAVVHGVDLSHHNIVEYSELKRCGAEFAILKMDRRFIEHRSSLRALGIPVIPYHYLSVAEGRISYKASPSRFSSPQNTKLDPDPATLSSLMQTADRMGKGKAGVFLAAYAARIPSGERKVDLHGLSGEIAVVDVEEVFSSASTPTQRKNYGRFYARMLSSWVEAVRRQYPRMIFVFYTFPSVYADYLQYALPRDHAVIHGMPVWLARTRGDASDFDLKSEKTYQRICLSSSGGNKCILHQYSHRALFGVPRIPKTVPPAHIDVNRLFKVKTVEDERGRQYVRSDWSADGRR